MKDKERCPNWAQFRVKLLCLLQVFSLYLDDLLLIGGGCCLVWAAWEAFGRPAGLAVAGLCLFGFALVIAKSRKGGSG